MGDERVTTYQSKQVVFDKTRIAELTEEEDGYTIVCLSPSERWFLLTLVEFLTTFRGRFVGGWTEDEFQALHAGTLRSLVCPMACETDILTISATLTTMATVMGEIRDRLGDSETDIDARLETIADKIVLLTTAVESAVPSSIFDDLEPILDGVGTILGATAILP